MSKSITNETKAKFDALLKAALNKKSSNINESTNNLITEELTDHCQELIANATKENDNNNGRNFILNKFLNENVIQETCFVDKESIIKPPVPKPPVPKPRQKKPTPQNSDSSGATFVIKPSNDVETHSGNTFILQKNENNSENSNETYNIPEKELGDVLVHSPKCTIPINVIDAHHDKNYDDADDINPPTYKPRNLAKKQILVEHTILAIDEEMSEETKQKNQDTTEELHAKIEYVDEFKPKPKSRKRDKIEHVDKRKPKLKTRKKDDDTNKYTYEKIVSIIVHKTDALHLNSLIIHPLVKIHILDGETGAYLKKSDKTRSGVLCTENNVSYLLPVLTQNFNLQKKRSLCPQWEETILINEDFEYIMNPKNNVIIFFEIVDFMKISRMSEQPTDAHKGWHGIAWAFLKLRGKNNSTNVNETVRLQLYQPGKYQKTVQEQCILHKWWKEKKCKKYPSTLYVTVGASISSEEVLQPKKQYTKSLTCNEDEIRDDSNNNGNVKENEPSLADLPKLHSDVSKIPNKLLVKLNNNEDEGCFVLKFSNAGAYLACSVFADNMYNIFVYSTSNFDEFYKLPAHQMLIYNIKWSSNDDLLLSSSADGTVSIWDMKNLNFMQILPHPSYVYCTEINHEGVIATGCYDNMFRIWTRNTGPKMEYILFEELDGHEGYITSICFTKNSCLAFSSDSVGCILKWNNSKNNWSLINVIKLPELRGVIINQIQLHKKEKLLIVHARDGIVRIVDIKNTCILRWLNGTTNTIVQTTACVTPCCNYFLAGGNDGKLYIWDLYTGKVVAIYQPFKNLSIKDLTIHCVDFHPKENILAFSHYGHRIPIFLYTYDKNCVDIDLIVMTEEKNKDKVVESGNNILKIQKKSLKTINTKPEKVVLKDILEKMDALMILNDVLH